jgi:hypothetical protein
VPFPCNLTWFVFSCKWRDTAWLSGWCLLSGGRRRWIWVNFPFFPWDNLGFACMESKIKPSVLLIMQFIRPTGRLG